MKIYKSLFFMFFSVSFITQSVAMGIIRSSDASRVTRFNKSPTDISIPGFTKTINDVLTDKKRLANRPASLDEKRDILKAVMATALIHGDNMSLPMHTIGHSNNEGNERLFRHFEILRITQELSQGLAVGTTVDDFDPMDYIDEYREISYLSTYSGIEIGALKEWFRDVYASHLIGLTSADRMYWRDPELYKMKSSADSGQLRASAITKGTPFAKVAYAESLLAHGRHPVLPGLEFATNLLINNVGEEHFDNTTLTLNTRSMRDFYTIIFNQKNEHNPFANINLFGCSPLIEENYGLIGDFAFFLTELKWIRDQKQASVKAGFLGLQRGHPYHFSHAEMGEVVINERSINQFIEDAENAFQQGYASYVGIVRNGRPGESTHYHVFFVTKNPSNNKISNAYVFNPGINPDVGKIVNEVDYRYLLKPFELVLNLKEQNNLDLESNGFSTGLQGGQQACGLAATLIAKHFAMFPLTEIDTREKVVEKLKELQQNFGYTAAQLDEKSGLYDPKKISDRTTLNKELIKYEKEFAEEIIAICDEIYELTSQNIDLEDALQSWLNQQDPEMHYKKSEAVKEVTAVVPPASIIVNPVPAPPPQLTAKGQTVNIATIFSKLDPTSVTKDSLQKAIYSSFKDLEPSDRDMLYHQAFPLINERLIEMGLPAAKE